MYHSIRLVPLGILLLSMLISTNILPQYALAATQETSIYNHSVFPNYSFSKGAYHQDYAIVSNTHMNITTMRRPLPRHSSSSTCNDDFFYNDACPLAKPYARGAE